MKIKTVLLIAICAIVTLSFTFASVKQSSTTKAPVVQQTSNEPVGGFSAEDKF